jgi:hypothetical protein
MQSGLPATSSNDQGYECRTVRVVPEILCERAKIVPGTSTRSLALLVQAEGKSPSPSPSPSPNAFRFKNPALAAGLFLFCLLTEVLFRRVGSLATIQTPRCNGTFGARADCQAAKRDGDRMFERLLEPGCTECPACQCGATMDIASIEVLPEGSDAAVRVYRCSGCEREMRLTVWATVPVAMENGSPRWV